MDAAATRTGVAEWTGHPRGSREYRRILVALLCAGIATFAQLYSVQGILPLISSGLGVSPSQSSLAVSAATVGIAVAVIPWSVAADRIGRVRAMTASIVAATVLGLVVPLSTSLPMLVGIRFAEGLALGGLPAIAMAYLSEEVHARHAALAAGTYVSGTTLGGLLGRIVAGPVAEHSNWRIGSLTVSLVALAAAVVFVSLVPAPRAVRPGKPMTSLRERLRHNLSDPAMLALFAQGFLLMGGFVAVYNYLGFRLEGAPFGLPQSVISLIFLAYLAGTVSSRLAGHAATRVGRGRVLAASTAVMIAGLLVTMIPSLIAALAGLVVLTFGFFGAHSIASGWTGARATVGRAQATSLYNLFYYAGSSVIGWLGGLVFQSFGWNALAWFVIALAVVAACTARAVRS
ncbi:MFS transporter [Rhodococcus sp. HNM0569]|uniref:MFS transporter n=1 Tax=Rhodococcus sp. HNM0569 TaxID=2716340 RepID=UPI00146EC78F|nr:MFS transporter [Rhodococcus sp. HNM0569]NLU83652.1 MFS transporter [Rhodococcus sp. HNM0569]